jgi:hypothetical protein
LKTFHGEVVGQLEGVQREQLIVQAVMVPVEEERGVQVAREGGDDVVPALVQNRWRGGGKWKGRGGD